MDSVPLIRPSSTFSPRGRRGTTAQDNGLLPKGRRWSEGPDEACDGLAEPGVFQLLVGRSCELIEPFANRQFL